MPDLPDTESWIWAVVLAPFIGSFLGVIIIRAEEPRSIAVGRSCCPHCGTPLTPADLVPVISWVALRARCRHCQASISAFYPLIELAAVMVAIWSATVASGWVLVASCVLGWTLLALAVIDFRLFLLPDFLTLPLTALGLIATAALDPNGLAMHAFGSAAGFAGVVVLRYLYFIVRGREGMGFGDAKLLAAAGAWVSLEGLPSVVLIASVSGMIFALLVSARAGRLSLTDRVPFGAFLALGTWIVWLYGPLEFG